MTRGQQIALAVLGLPTLAGAFIVSATLGPIGALAYGGILLAGVNARHLVREHHADTRTSPIRIIRERLHR